MYFVLLLTSGVSICTILNFLCSDQILNLLFLSLFDTCGWCNGLLVFRLTTGPPIRQPCCLSPFAYKVPCAYHPQEMHYELDAVLSVPL